MARIYLVFFSNDFKVDLLDEPILVKYADDSNIISPVCDTSDSSEALGKQFMEWSSNNGLSCNPSKCKELASNEKRLYNGFSSRKPARFPFLVLLSGKIADLLLMYEIS